ncbi:S8 family serine peptidase [Kitasatospora azatica]|uniref:S8 family serine peptidase n=1 Tax=Kitasatospora azatica TaxID=58347 RepID=UPI00055F47CD|nr:S8 family serine peptidase [Kitasatospora azatica]
MPHQIRSHRRLARATLAASLVAALGAGGLTSAFAADSSPAPAPGGAKPGISDKLSAHDADLLAQAKAEGAATVTLMLAVKPGSTAATAEQLTAAGASVGKTIDRIGYVRATVATDKADALLGRATKLSEVQAIDLNESVPMENPYADTDAAPAATRTPKVDSGVGDGGTGSPAAGAALVPTPTVGAPYFHDEANPAPQQQDHRPKPVTGPTPEPGKYPAPGADTPAANPYQPANDIGAVDFVKRHPEADGRGVTIGILDSGVDLAHPALQWTTTGERKIVDWVTETDPLIDGDGTWLPMLTDVSGPSFGYKGRTYTAPAGNYKIALFKESVTLGGDEAGDLNRNGTTTDSWAVLYDPATGKVRVDLNDNADFTDDQAMSSYKESNQVGHFGTVDARSPIAKTVPFTIETRKNVDLSPVGGPWVGKHADFVNIGLVASEHGTHVAGITAANGLFGGRMTGAAPGAKIISARACVFGPGCSATALTEGMADLALNHGVDVINMSIGGLPVLNDGNSARSRLYTQIIEQTGVQLVISAGNDGPGLNSIGDPGLASKVISVGAAISRETWASNYGAKSAEDYGLFTFSSRGPREDGGFTPTLVAPGSSVNTIPTWEPGASFPAAGYELPPGYGMLQGTSMASPQATGATALLISAAKEDNRYAKGSDDRVSSTPLALRNALTSSARWLPGYQAAEQGAGLIDVNAAWHYLENGAGDVHEYTVKAPATSVLSPYLATPGFGAGVYDRAPAAAGGPAVGKRSVYDVTITRTTGDPDAITHRLTIAGDDGTWAIQGGRKVDLPLNQPVTVKVAATPKSAGLHSAILRVDDEDTLGIDQQIMLTSIVGQALSAPDFQSGFSGSVARSRVERHFITVPEGAKTLAVNLDGVAAGSQVRFLAIAPDGMPADPTASNECWTNYATPGPKCGSPTNRSYRAPQAGVWEIVTEARRTTGTDANPYSIDAKILGVGFDPQVQTLDSVTQGAASPVSWTLKNAYGPFQGVLKGGELGSAVTTRPTIANHGAQTSTVVLPAGVSRFNVAIGHPDDAKADLDLSVYLDGKLVGQSAGSTSEESVTLLNPAAGTYTVKVDGYSVPSGTTGYDYRDVYFSPQLGSVNAAADPVTLAAGGTATVQAQVLATGPAPAGRQLFGEVNLVDAHGAPAGTGSVLISKVNAG